jgi:hypothetical protein
MPLESGRASVPRAAAYAALVMRALLSSGSCGVLLNEKALRCKTWCSCGPEGQSNYVQSIRTPRYDFAVRDGRYDVDMGRLFAVVVLLIMSSLAAAMDRVGDWDYFEHTERFTDEVTHSIIAMASEAPAVASTANFWVTCGDKEFEVIYVLFAEAFIGFEDSYEVTYRVDKRQAVSSVWRAVDTDVLMISSVEFARLEADLIAGDELLIRVHDGHRGMDYVFPIREFRSAFNRLPCSLFYGR